MKFDHVTGDTWKGGVFDCATMKFIYSNNHSSGGSETLGVEWCLAEATEKLGKDYMKYCKEAASSAGEKEADLLD